MYMSQIHKWKFFIQNLQVVLFPELISVFLCSFVPLTSCSSTLGNSSVKKKNTSELKWPRSHLSSPSSSFIYWKPWGFGACFILNIPFMSPNHWKEAISASELSVLLSSSDSGSWLLFLSNKAADANHSGWLWRAFAPLRSSRKLFCAWKHIFLPWLSFHMSPYVRGDVEGVVRCGPWRTSVCHPNKSFRFQPEPWHHEMKSKFVWGLSGCRKAVIFHHQTDKLSAKGCTRGLRCHWDFPGHKSQSFWALKFGSFIRICCSVIASVQKVKILRKSGST